MTAELVFGAEAIHQEIDDPPALRRATEIAESRLLIERGEQHAQRLAERLVAEVVEARLGAGLRKDRGFIERRPWLHGGLPL